VTSLSSHQSITFDANTSIITADKSLDRYFDRQGIDEPDREAWSQIIQRLTNAHRWLGEEFAISCNVKQLKLDL
jgi:hypothetical protein